jgi:two-component system nitrate/nitrite sensor histidine kinase NarX
LGLDLLIIELADEDPIKTGVERSIAQLQSVIQDIRSYIFELRPRKFDGDLGQALVDLGREFQENSTIPTHAIISPSVPPLDHETAIAFYVVAHEALSNVRKYAQANRVEIVLSEFDGQWELEIRDDGTGFDSAQSQSEVHRGLRNMESRAKLVGARLDIMSSPGDGTTVRLSRPITAAAV